ncbi:Poly(rC)-binding protein [Echinococcus granulosus]|uniref:Poly(RC)-binding protein n=1 Tax=Echinococcus granulosus TaxID=6210 RepID=W6V234_ECHGR|nr:Poly(rC)-binding protein [Echinococcus granulosus]EUB65022.1 Poly(rC)-binding protein [Echinococcus granulosus]
MITTTMNDSEVTLQTQRLAGFKATAKKMEEIPSLPRISSRSGGVVLTEPRNRLGERHSHHRQHYSSGRGWRGELAGTGNRCSLLRLMQGFRTPFDCDMISPAEFGCRFPQNQSSCMEVTKSLLLRDELVGCIIGRGGSKINMIRQASKAFIKIADAEEGNTFRRITIKGTPNSVQMAIFYINYTRGLLIKEWQLSFCSVNLHQQIVQMNLAIDMATKTRSRSGEYPHLLGYPCTVIRHGSRNFVTTRLNYGPDSNKFSCYLKGLITLC